MENYRILYRITVVHEYFNDTPCAILQCQMTYQSCHLAKQRGLLFRQIAVNEWIVLLDINGSGPDTENDVLTLEMNFVNPLFPLYTEWEDFNPITPYVLELPQEEGNIDAAKVIRPLIEGKRKVGTPFCTILLRLTEQLTKTEKEEQPKEAVLHFYTPKVRWEYLFLSRLENNTIFENMLLEDTEGSIEFSSFEKCIAYGRTAWRTVSQERIPMRSNYKCRLRLVAQFSGRQQKRILLSVINTPEPGRYKVDSKQTGFIRQVCYF